MVFNGAPRNMVQLLENEDKGFTPKTLRKTHDHIIKDPHIYKNVILVNKITKMPLWAQNVGPMMWTSELTWCRRANDVRMT